jgi:hypothetical protein
VSDSRTYSRGYVRARPYRPVPPPPAQHENRRSHAAVPIAIAVVLLGLYLARYSFLAPALFGVLLLVSGLSFLSTRLNPLSPHFYLTRKPSWLAVGVVFLGALVLLYSAYGLIVQQLGHAWPGL